MATTTIFKWVVILALLPFACTGGTCAGRAGVTATAPPAPDKIQVKTAVKAAPEKPAMRRKAPKGAPNSRRDPSDEDASRTPQAPPPGDVQ